ncbi:unnamed protein product [Plutella xylostella]|uniref:Odorant receptor n=2 Tax=Plutella xylostella TaxID=51655 RepID=A0A8S4GAX5_PLUXY|nr:unnamed protein product [Plutella xylostella]
MQLLSSIWRKLTQTRALEYSSGSYETQFFETVYRVMFLAGVSSHDRGLRLAYSYLVKLTLVVFVGSELWYLFSQTADLDHVIDNINVTLIHLIAMYRYRDMMRHKAIYKRLAGAMESPHFDVSTPARRALLQAWARRSERYLQLLLALGTCTLAAWYVYPLVDDLDYNLTVAVRLPYDYRTPQLYAATYLATLVAFNYTSYFVMVNDLIMQVHLMHLLCQYTVLADCFRNILEDCSDEEENKNENYHSLAWGDKYVKRLGDLVNQHKFIMSNTLELKRIWSTPMLMQFLASSMLICLAGYQVTATIKLSITKFLMSLLYLAYNMFELFIFCRWCDEIKIQSENIAEAVYCSGWERGAAARGGVRARLMLVLTRARRPLVLSAGGLYDLSLASYSTLVKTSYSALTVLLRVSDD